MFAVADGRARRDDAVERWDSWRRARIREKRPAFPRPKSKTTREQLRRYRVTRRLRDKLRIAEIRARHAMPPLPYIGRSMRLRERIEKTRHSARRTKIVRLVMNRRQG